MTTDQIILFALLGAVFILPLLAYVLAGVLWMIMKMFPGEASGLEVRTAFFWALLAATPVWLLHGLLKGFIGQGVAVSIVGAIVLLTFLGILVGGFRALLGRNPVA